MNKSNIAEVKQTVERVKSGVVMKDILDCYPGIGTYEYVLSFQQVFNVLQGIFNSLIVHLCHIHLSVCLSACLPAYLPLSVFADLSDNMGAWMLA